MSGGPGHCFAEMSLCTRMSFAFWLKLDRDNCPGGAGILGARPYFGGTIEAEGFSFYCKGTGELRQVC